MVIMPKYTIKSGKTGKYLNTEFRLDSAKEYCIARILKNPSMVLLIERDGQKVYRIVKEGDVIVFRNIQTGKRTTKAISILKQKIKADSSGYLAVYYDDKGTLGTLDHARKDAVKLYEKYHTWIPICKDYVGNTYGIVNKTDKGWVFEVRWTGKSYRFDPRTGKTIKKI